MEEKTDTQLLSEIVNCFAVQIALSLQTGGATPTNFADKVIFSGDFSFVLDRDCLKILYFFAKTNKREDLATLWQSIFCGKFGR